MEAPAFLRWRKPPMTSQDKRNQPSPYLTVITAITKTHCLPSGNVLFQVARPWCPLVHGRSQSLLGALGNLLICFFPHGVVDPVERAATSQETHRGPLQGALGKKKHVHARVWKFSEAHTYGCVCVCVCSKAMHVWVLSLSQPPHPGPWLSLV